MIVGLGVDICQVQRLADSHARFGDRFAERMLHPDELAELSELHEAMRVRFLARRFAAKEAALKALGTGARQGLGLSQVAVAHDELGKPLLRFHGPAADRARHLGVDRTHLSISDERDYAIAMVVLEGAARGVA